MPIERISITDRAMWLALRQQDLTASDIAAVAGVDPRKSALKVYAEKTGAIMPDEDNDILRRGRWLEAAVVEALRDKHPEWEIRRAGVYLRDPSIRMGATPDVVAIDPSRAGIGNIQCKVVARPIFEREWDEDTAPLKFQLQSLAEGMLVDAAWNMVAALVVDTYTADLVERDIPRHAAAEGRLREIVQNFWKNVAAGVMPAADYSQDADVLGKLYPDSFPGIVADFSGDNLLPNLLAERSDLLHRIEECQARVDEIETEVKAKLGKAESGLLPGWKITWKTQERREVVIPPSSFRVLRITDRREKEGMAI